MGEEIKVEFSKDKIRRDGWHFCVICHLVCSCLCGRARKGEIIAGDESSAYDALIMLHADNDRQQTPTTANIDNTRKNPEETKDSRHMAHREVNQPFGSSRSTH